MQRSWLEAVPNVSLGKDPEAVARLGRGLGPTLVDVHRDADHDRSVFTMLGTADDLVRSLDRLAARAFGQVDLGAQRGVHPRVGALDVVPFVPLDGASMTSAVRAARRFARHLARRHQLPVFLYGEAARVGRPSQLPELRRGGLTGLAERMQGGLEPDFGPGMPDPHRGVTLVGAREVLVAYNVDFPPTRLRETRALARSLRASSGGLPGLRALGLHLRSSDRAQLSMNFLDHEQTCPSQVLTRLREEGQPVVRSEVVGLLPEAVLRRAAAAHLALDDDFDPEARVLEVRLRRARARDDLRRLSPTLDPAQRTRVRRVVARALGCSPRELR